MQTRFPFSRKSLVLRQTHLIAGFALFFVSPFLADESPPSLPAKTEETVRLATFNIRYAASSDKGDREWSARRASVVRQIERINPDVIGFQEVLWRQLEDLAAALPAFAWVGVGRDDGIKKGELAPVFYRKDRFSLVSGQHGTFWLSDTPAVPGSMSWGNQIPRIATWLVLAERKGDGQFHLLNTHWDHQSVEARRRSGRMIGDWLADKIKNPRVIVMGDLNEVPGADGVTALLEVKAQEDESGVALLLRHCIEKMGKDGPIQTFHNWTGETTQNIWIDHILVGTGFIVEKAGVDAWHDQGIWPSDHYPVWADLRFR